MPSYLHLPLDLGGFKPRFSCAQRGPEDPLYRVGLCGGISPTQRDQLFRSVVPAASHPALCKERKDGAPLCPGGIGKSRTKVGTRRPCATPKSYFHKFYFHPVLLTYEFIAGAMYRAKVQRVGRIFLQLLAKPHDVVIDGARGGVVLVSPDLIQEFFAGDHAL